MARIGNRSSDFSLVNLLLTSQLLSEALDPKHPICYRDLLLVLIFGILALESLGNFPPRSLSALDMDYDRNDALLHWLFRQTQGDAWFRPNEENISSGIALRVNDGIFVLFALLYALTFPL